MSRSRKGPTKHERGVEYTGRREIVHGYPLAGREAKVDTHRLERRANRQAPERELAEWDETVQVGQRVPRIRCEYEREFRDWNPFDDVYGVLPEARRHWFEEWRDDESLASLEAQEAELRRLFGIPEEEAA